MAKQKGIHQLKGKVGDMSYFQMAGVQSGLVRRIPEGLSSRVKNDEVYANTRLNNREFTNAALISKAAFNSVPNRVASMLRRFAFADMLKEAKQYIVAGSGNWGQRIPTTTLDVVVVDLLENHAKFGPYDNQYGEVDFSPVQAGATVISWTYGPYLKSYMDSIGANGLTFRTQLVAIAEPQYVFDPFLILGRTDIESQYTDDIDDTGGGETLATFPVNAASFDLTPDDFTVFGQTPNHGFVLVVTFLPYRTINNVQHILYEHATFVSIPMGTLPAA